MSSLPKFALLLISILYIFVEAYVYPYRFGIGNCANNYQEISNAVITEKRKSLLYFSHVDTIVAAGDEESEKRSEDVENLEELIDMMFNEDHTKELSKKVEEAMQNDWDLQNGVNGAGRKPLPLKMNSDIWCYKAKQEFIKGNFTGALRIYRQLIDYNPCDGRPWLGLTRIHQKRSETELAEKAFKDGLYYNPKNPYLLQAWAVMLERQGKLEQAMTLLTTSVKNNPKHAASWVAMGKLLTRKGNVEEAKFCYQSAVEGDPSSYVAFQAWGVLEAESGNIQKARDLFQSALNISSNSLHTYQAWATLERTQGNLDVAEKLIRQALHARPENTRCRVSLAEIFEMRGEFEDARKAFHDGMVYADQSGDAGFYQCWALFELRRSEDIENNNNNNKISLIDPSSTINVNSPSASAAASASSVQDEESRANIRRLFKKAVTINKFHSASWIAWAKYEQNANNLDVARKLLTTGIAHFPHTKNQGWFHCCLGNIACKQGDMNTARSCYERAINTTPPQKSLKVRLEYARMEQLYGDCNIAAHTYENTLKLFPNDERVWKAYFHLERTRVGGNVNKLLPRWSGFESLNYSL